MTTNDAAPAPDADVPAGCVRADQLESAIESKMTFHATIKELRATIAAQAREITDLRAQLAEAHRMKLIDMYAGEKVLEKLERAEAERDEWKRRASKWERDAKRMRALERRDK